MSRLPAVSLTFVAALAIVGCADSIPTTPSSPARGPTAGTPLRFVGDAPSVPHVMRFEGRLIAGWFDVARNTAIIIGAPLNPAESRICGGTVRNQFMPMQFVGDMEEVVKQLLQNPDATVLAYDEIASSLEEALCEVEPVGRGVGLYLRSDNDFFGTGGNRANAFMEHLSADLEMTGGGKGHVSATLRGTWVRGGFVHVGQSVVITNLP